MIGYSQLLEAWRRRPPGPVYNCLSFAGNDLVFGPDIRLATLDDRPLPVMIDRQDERILALLSVAYWRAISANVLRPIRNAARAYRCGDTALAHIYLAHSGLSKIGATDRELCRLFVADRLLESGVTPLELLDGLGIDTAPLRLVKASPDDPRHPGWPAGTRGGLGGKFRPRNGDAAPLDLSLPIPIDFSGGFHDAVVDAWIAYFQAQGIPAVKTPAVRIIGSAAVIGFPDIVVNMPIVGLTVVEVKTGKEPLLTPNQAIYFPMLMLGGHIYSNDPRIGQLGLVPGAPFPPLPVIILHAPGPNLPYKAFELPPPQFEP